MNTDGVAFLVQNFNAVDCILFSPYTFQKLVDAIRDPLKRAKIISILDGLN